MDDLDAQSSHSIADFFAVQTIPHEPSEEKLAGLSEVDVKTQQAVESILSKECAQANSLVVASDQPELTFRPVHNAELESSQYIRDLADSSVETQTAVASETAVRIVSTFQLTTENPRETALLCTTLRIALINEVSPETKTEVVPIAEQVKVIVQENEPQYVVSASSEAGTLEIISGFSSEVIDSQQLAHSLKEHALPIVTPEEAQLHQTRAQIGVQIFRSRTRQHLNSEYAQMDSLVFQFQTIKNHLRPEDNNRFEEEVAAKRDPYLKNSNEGKRKLLESRTKLDNLPVSEEVKFYNEDTDAEVKINRTEDGIAAFSFTGKKDRSNFTTDELNTIIKDLITRRALSQEEGDFILLDLDNELNHRPIQKIHINIGYVESDDMEKEIDDAAASFYKELEGLVEKYTLEMEDNHDHEEKFPVLLTTGSNQVSSAESEIVDQIKMELLSFCDYVKSRRSHEADEKQQLMANIKKDDEFREEIKLIEKKRDENLQRIGKEGLRREQLIAESRRHEFYQNLLDRAVVRKETTTQST